MFSSELPQHCHPATSFLSLWSSTFSACVPTDLALLSTVLGSLSIVSWLFAQLPQIYKNISLASTAGLSIWFLAEWCLGDITNLLGAIFLKQAKWQIVVAGYYCFVDAVLVGQWIWYTGLGKGWEVRRYEVGSWHGSAGDDSDASSLASDSESIRSVDTVVSTPRDIAGIQGRRAPNDRMLASPREKGSLASTPKRAVGIHGGSSAGLMTPKTVVLVACLVSLCRASPIGMEQERVASSVDGITIAGTILSWTSTTLYLGSRFPQLWKNYKRQSTSGLSPHLFMAAFFGNLFYSSSILTNPCVWYDFRPYGGRGWVGPEGSTRSEFILRALPFWLGAAGVLILDGLMGIQFLMYGETVVVVEEVDNKGKRRRWKEVSGWMRGWIPSFANAKRRRKHHHESRERQRLLADEQHGQSANYGSL